MKRSFDHWAKPYRLLEQLVFGNSLQDARCCYLEHIPPGMTEVLVLGDGDGRFSQALLTARPQVRITSVDLSPAMLVRAKGRLSREQRARFQPICQDALDYPFPTSRYDAIACQFFFDCFSAAQVERLLSHLEKALTPRGVFLYADFAIPQAGFPRWLGKALVAGLYFTFRGTTEIAGHSLPRFFWPDQLQLENETTWKSGIITSQLRKRVLLERD